MFVLIEAKAIRNKPNEAGVVQNQSTAGPDFLNQGCFAFLGLVVTTPGLSEPTSGMERRGQG